MTRAPVLAALVAIALGWPLAGLGASPGQAAADRGAALYRDGDFEGARDAFQEAVRLDAGHLKAWESLGWAEQRLGNEEEALRIWKDLLRLDPERASTRRAIASLEQEAERRQRELERRAREQDLELARGEREREQARRARAEQDRRPKANRERRVEPPAPAPPRPRPEEVRAAQARARVRAEIERGDAALRRDDLREAERAYRAALDVDPADTRVLARLGRTLARGGRSDEAVAIWRTAAATPGAPASVHGYLALEYVERKEEALARGAYERAASATPRDEPWALLQLAEVAFAVGDPAGAERALADLFAIKRLDEAWTVRGADVFLRRATAERGVAFFDRAVPGATPGRSRALTRLLVRAGGEAFRADRLDLAAKAYERAVALEPTMRSALRDLGFTYRRMGRWDDAERTWRQYAKAYPAQADPYDLLAALHLDREQYVEALEATRRSLAVQPGSKGATARATRALFGLSRLTEARALAADLAARYPGDAQAQRLYADALTKSRRLLEAPRQWEKAVALQPASKDTRHGWLRALYEAGDTERAIQGAAEIADDPGTPAGVLLLLAEHAAALGDHAEAARWYRTLTERFPEEPLYWRRLTGTLDRLGRRDAQLAVAIEAARRFPGRADVRLDLPSALVSAGRRVEALEEARELVRTFPESRIASNSFLALLVGAKRPAEALAHISRSPASFYPEVERSYREAALHAMLRQDRKATHLLRSISDPAPGRRVVPIILYHGIAERGPTLQITAEAFDRQMAAIAAAGYDAITLTELTRMIDGELPFPPKPILITFDDARSDSFELGDPVLERYGLKATMFVPTGRIGPDDGFHAGWATLARHAASGRWDMQGHGHHAHDRIPIAPGGQAGEFLVYRKWLASESRAETYDEYVLRIDEDYRVGKRALEQAFGGHEILGYAYPLNKVAREQPGEPRTDPPLNEALASRYYRFGFIQDDSGYNVLGAAPAPFMLRRFEVPGQWSGEDLLVHLARRAPPTAARLELARVTLDAGRPRAARRLVERLAVEEPLVDAHVEKILAHIAWREGRPRDAGVHFAAAAARVGLEPGEQGFATRLAWRNDPRGSAEARAFADSDGRSLASVGSTMRQPLPGNVDVELGFWQLRMGDRGEGAVVGQQLSASASATIGREVDVSGWTRYWAIATLPTSLEGGAGINVRLDRHVFAFHWARENVASVRAMREEIGRRSLRARYAFTARNWRAEARAGHLAFNDGNTWLDVEFSALRLVDREQRWAVGATYEFDDARFESGAYWTPQRLSVVTGKIRYGRGWPDGSSFSIQTGLGGAYDPLRDVRPAASARLDLSQAFGRSDKWAIGIGLSGRAIPGYRSVEGTLRLETRF